VWLIEQAGRNLQPLDDNGPENMPLTVKENRAIGEQFVRYKDKKKKYYVTICVFIYKPYHNAYLTTW
jgi:hypothetical protein